VRNHPPLISHPKEVDPVNSSPPAGQSLLALLCNAQVVEMNPSTTATAPARHDHAELPTEIVQSPTFKVHVQALVSAPTLRAAERLVGHACKQSSEIPWALVASEEIRA